MQTEQRADGWWITGIPDCPDAGPYTTRAMADEDREGMAEYYKHESKARWWTVELGAHSRQATK